jgi:hypothetical protein
MSVVCLTRPGVQRARENQSCVVRGTKPGSRPEHNARREAMGALGCGRRNYFSRISTFSIEPLAGASIAFVGA